MLDTFQRVCMDKVPGEKAVGPLRPYQRGFQKQDKVAGLFELLPTPAGIEQVHREKLRLTGSSTVEKGISRC